MRVVPLTRHSLQGLFGALIDVLDRPAGFSGATIVTGFTRLPSAAGSGR